MTKNMKQLFEKSIVIRTSSETRKKGESKGKVQIDKQNDQ